MSVKRAFFSVFQKIMVVCCAIFFGFANAFSANLPAGYTELEYIQSDGNSWIDTGIYGTEHHGMEIKYSYPTLDSGYSGRLCGGRTGAGSENAFAYIATSNGTLAPTNNTFYVSSNNGTALTLTPLDTGIHMASINFSNNQKSYFDGQEIQTGGKTTSYVHQFTTNLFRAYNGTSGWATPARARIYFCKITDSGALVRDFVPAKNSSGVIGMYDTVNDVFYTNQGTGTFTAGPVVLNPCRNLFDKTPIIVNRYINSSGTITSDGTNRTVVSGEIYVKPSTTYTLSGVGNIYGASYNRSGFQYQADGTPISAINYTGTGTVTFTTDANCAYVRVMSLTANVDTAMLEEGSTATDYVPFCAPEIKIATTAYNAARFSPVKTDLDSAVATIREIVTKTINQTAAIASLQADKQTRPEDACPAGKKCLLVETEENGVIVPHWYPIIENIYGLPAGYTPLEYIQSRSSPAEAYIDTGLNFNSNYMYEITYAKGGLQNVFMGARGTTDYLAKGNFSLTYNSSSCVYSSTSTNSTPVNFGDTTFGVKHTVKYQQSTSTLLFDDTNKWDSNWITNIEIPYHVYLFAFNQGGTPGGARMEYARIYAYSVKNSNGIFIQNFVPAKNSSGVIGMYDLVNDVFYTNQGTGTFTAGPEM